MLYQKSVPYTSDPFLWSKKAQKEQFYTERLIVRTPSANDANDIFELMKDRETALITGFTPMGDISEAEGKIRQSLANENMFIITSKENPEHSIGVFEFTCQKVSTTQGEKQKWGNNHRTLYPIPGCATLLSAIESGVFRLHKDAVSEQLCLEKISESFTFNFKIYDLDCETIMQRIIHTWSSNLFKENRKNPGVIFNGLRGTGKTHASAS